MLGIDLAMVGKVALPIAGFLFLLTSLGPKKTGGQKKQTEPNTTDEQTWKEWWTKKYGQHQTNIWWVFLPVLAGWALIWLLTRHYFPEIWGHLYETGLLTWIIILGLPVFYGMSKGNGAVRAISGTLAVLVLIALFVSDLGPYQAKADDRIPPIPRSSYDPNELAAIFVDAAPVGWGKCLKVEIPWGREFAGLESNVPVYVRDNNGRFWTNTPGQPHQLEEWPTWLMFQPVNKEVAHIIVWHGPITKKQDRAPG